MIARPGCPTLQASCREPMLLLQMLDHKCLGLFVTCQGKVRELTELLHWISSPQIKYDITALSLILSWNKVAITSLRRLGLAEMKKIEINFCLANHKNISHLV